MRRKVIIEMALEDYKQARELNLMIVIIISEWLYCYQQLDQYENSLSTYLQYIEKFGEDSVVYNNMATIYEKNIQDYVKALEYYDKSIATFKRMLFITIIKLSYYYYVW